MFVEAVEAGHRNGMPQEVSFRKWRDIMLDELCAAIFTSLPRSDQRASGADYIRGLLDSEGRKSIRNIAAQVGGPAAEQRLHHFVCDSTWDWRVVRRALAQYLTGVTPPVAWVVHPMIIPKAGRSSVGVERRFFPTLGQVSNAQEAWGVWAARDDYSVPVSWRLHLPRSWLDDPGQRQRAAIPDSIVAEPSGSCATQSYLGMVHDWGLPARPVVLDGRGASAVEAVHSFAARGVPVLVRIDGDHPLRVEPAVMPGWAGEVPASRVAAGVRNAGDAVICRSRPTASTVLPTAVTKVRIRLPSQPDDGGFAGDELLLVSIREYGRRWPTELWLTTMVEATSAELLQLARLPKRVARDFANVSSPLGVRDFTGRSFAGWHRHVTLASSAHAVAMLSRWAPEHTGAPGQGTECG